MTSEHVFVIVPTVLAVWAALNELIKWITAS
jgi:hypothetical protein